MFRMNGFGLLTILLCAWRAVAYQCQMLQGGCSCRASSGEIVNLQGMRFNNRSAPDHYLYSYSPCGNLPCGKPQSTLVALCQITSSGTTTFQVGLIPPASINSIQNGFSITYTQTPEGRVSTVDVLCSSELTEFVALGESHLNSKHYRFQLKLKDACVGSLKAKKLSTGSILLIILLSVVVVYLATGLIYNKFVLKATGVEVIPNHRFWAELPFWIRDGCLFTFRGCKKQDNYQSI